MSGLGFVDDLEKPLYVSDALDSSPLKISSHNNNGYKLSSVLDGDMTTDILGLCISPGSSKISYKESHKNG
jgi:hypothetical protein